MCWNESASLGTMAGQQMAQDLAPTAMSWGAQAVSSPSFTNALSLLSGMMPTNYPSYDYSGGPTANTINLLPGKTTSQSPTATGLTSFTPTPTPSAGKSLLGNVLTGAGKLGQNIFGGGGKTGEGNAPWWVKPAMMGAGYLIPQPESTIPSGQELLSQYQGVSTSPEGAAAKAQLLDYINNPQNVGGQATTDYIASINADWDQQEAKALSEFDASWNARGYNAYGSDYEKAKGELQTKLTTARNLQVNQARTQLVNQQIDAQLKMIAAAYGVDQALLQELMTLDVQVAAQKYGLSVESVNQFRKAIYDMALGVNQPNVADQLTTALKNLGG